MKFISSGGRGGRDYAKTIGARDLRTEAAPIKHGGLAFVTGSSGRSDESPVRLLYQRRLWDQRLLEEL